jgi:hypothetical protein
MERKKAKEGRSKLDRIVADAGSPPLSISAFLSARSTAGSTAKDAKDAENAKRCRAGRRWPKGTKEGERRAEQAGSHRGGCRFPPSFDISVSLGQIDCWFHREGRGEREAVPSWGVAERNERRRKKGEAGRVGSWRMPVSPSFDICVSFGQIDCCCLSANPTVLGWTRSWAGDLDNRRDQWFLLRQKWLVKAN